MDDLIKQGADALKRGDRETARQLLAQAVKKNPDSEKAWGWLYNACENDKDRIYVLKKMLSINPNNEKAKQVLSELQNFTPPLNMPVRTNAVAKSNTYPAAMEKPRVWYRSEAAYLLFFLVVTPLWVILILTDKKQPSVAVRIFAIGILGIYLVGCCLYSTWLLSIPILSKGDNASNCLDLSYRCSYGTLGGFVGGEAKNTCDRPVNAILLRAQVRDRNKNIVWTGIGTTGSDILFPQATSKFTIYADVSYSDFDSCSVSIENANFGN